MYSRNLTSRDCPLCGASVFVHHDQDYIPISMPGLIIGNIAGQNTPSLPADENLFAYIPHICEPGDVELHDRRRAAAAQQLRDLIEDLPTQDQHNPATDEEWRQSAYANLDSMRDDHDQIQQELIKMVDREGLARPCPKCDVQIGYPCENLVSRRQGSIKLTKRPHNERLPWVNYTEIDPTNSAQVEIKNHISARNNIAEKIENLRLEIGQYQESSDLIRLRDQIREIVDSMA